MKNYRGKNRMYNRKAVHELVGGLFCVLGIAVLVIAFGV